ncbi:ATP-dependent RecD-like DNA helicase [Sutterella sp.]|uniref:ATP-dependent DNA helicase n=1 Tax=Sutterella sp. TaxID=1981025 RepID=UPI0026E0155E|nr:AAA family ATPase [Sutterella sp.]MDO5531610.1 AAA family ATPase [Sutterella sp.]
MNQMNQTVAAPEGGLAGLGDALMNVARRRAEAVGKSIPDEAAITMRALMHAFARAEDRGSVCVRADTAAQTLSALTCEEVPEGFERDPEEELAELGRGLGTLIDAGLAQNLDDFLAAAKVEAEHPGKGAFTPLVIDFERDEPGQTRIYFARFAFEEVMLAQKLLALMGTEADAEEMKAAAESSLAKLEELARKSGLDSLQKKAVELAVTRRLAIISGGPGTGKTTTVAQILECLLTTDGTLRIGLAAPTGKATGRMVESIGASSQRGGLEALSTVLKKDAGVPDEERQIRSRTIHKWLLSPTPAGGFPGKDNPLALDVLIVDEASMVDIHLAARLFDAIGPVTRVVILGDKHQLAAVGPGAVFAELSERTGALAPCTVELLVSRRFQEGSVIAELAGAINHQGEAADLPEPEVFGRVLQAFETEDEHYRASLHEAPEIAPSSDEGKAEIEAYNRTGLTQEARDWLDEALARYGEVLMRWRDAWISGAGKADLERLTKELWGTLADFRALAAQRTGAMSVTAINDYADEFILRNFWPIARGRGSGEQYPGRVVIVRRNDESLGVHNGDVGIVLPRETPPEAGHAADDAAPAADETAPDRRDDRRSGPVLYEVYFGDADRSIPAALLPSHDTAWAMTIHQSQGSEFGRVAVFLPVKPGSGLATRELLYTGVTRTKQSVDIFGSRGVLAESVRRPTVRDGSLGKRLTLGRWS